MRSRKKTSPAIVHKSVYWDACIWIAWLTDEEREPGDMNGVLESVNHIQCGRIDLVVSRIIETEVLDSALGKEAASIFQKTLKRFNVTTVDFEPPIVALSKEIREFYAGEKRQGVATKVPGLADAIHLATAINQKVEAFYTFDNGRYGGGSLLRLNGSVAGHPLAICKPPFEHYNLFAKWRPSK